MGAEKDDTFKGGAVENVKLFIASIREGKPIYNYEEIACAAISRRFSGRTAAYLQSRSHLGRDHELQREVVGAISSCAGRTGLLACPAQYFGTLGST